MSVLMKYWKPLVLMLLVAFLLWRSYSAGYDSADAAWKLQWAQRDADDAKFRVAEEARQRNIEQQRQIAVVEEGRKADEEMAKAKADAAHAQRVGDGLQQQLDRLQKRYAADRATSKLSSAAAVSQAKSETIVLLAQLYRESDKAAGEYAEEADRNYVKGSSCERTYNRVTNGNAFE